MILKNVQKIEPKQVIKLLRKFFNQFSKTIWVYNVSGAEFHVAPISNKTIDSATAEIFEVNQVRLIDKSKIEEARFQIALDSGNLKIVDSKNPPFESIYNKKKDYWSSLSSTRDNGKIYPVERCEECQAVDFKTFKESYVKRVNVVNVVTEEENEKRFNILNKLKTLNWSTPLKESQNIPNNEKED